MQPETIPRAAPPSIVLFDQEGGQALADELALDGFDVRLIGDPALLGKADLIVVAHTSKKGAGLDALRALRQGQLAGSGARVLWISRDATDTLRAFAAGADDVIPAPYAYAELVARVRSLLRRDRPSSTVVRYEALEIDTATRIIKFSETLVELRRQEYELLAYLAREPYRVYTKHELLRDVWGYRQGAATRTVESHASRLRKALARAGAEGWVRSSWGVGYRLAP